MLTIGVAIICLAVVIAVIALRAKAISNRQHTWEKVEGTITSSNVEMSGGYWVPMIRYEYSHRGRTYRGDRVRSLEISVNWLSPAESAVAKFPENASVIVYVNPADSTFSVLEPGGDSRFLPLLLFMAIAVGSIGVWLLAH
jgi:hypothetical protein